MARLDFGKFGTTNGGTYSSSTTYEINTIVSYNNTTWVSTQSTTGNTPAEGSSYWKLVNKEGVDGGDCDESISLTLSSSTWTGNDAPYEYDLSSQLQTSLGDKYNTNLITKAYYDNDNATSAQNEVIESYDIVNGGRGKLYANGDKPAVTLPYIIVVNTDVASPSQLADIDFLISVLNRSINTSWATASDETIVKMVELGKNGYIDLADYWSVGNERQVTLNNIATTGTATNGVAWSVDDAIDSQEVTFVLMHAGLYNLVTPVLDKNKNIRTKVSFVCGMKDVIDGDVAFHSTSTDMTVWWGNSSVRNWCNGGFYSAIPSTLRPIFAQFNLNP